MRVREFLGRMRDLAEPLLGPAGPSFHWRSRFNLLQLYHEHPAVHYEVWVQGKSSRLEIGLHFEGEREANYRWAALLAGRLVEIQAQLGPSLEVEEWTKSWTRLHETIPYERLDEDLALRTAQRLARLVAVVDPMLGEGVELKDWDEGA